MTEKTQLNMEVIVSEEDHAVYVKLTGFADLPDADSYAEYLVNALPLLLFQTEVVH